MASALTDSNPSVLDQPKMEDPAVLEQKHEQPATTTRLTLVIQTTTPKKKKPDVQYTDIKAAKFLKQLAKQEASKRPKETVIRYTNPHDHFVQRKYRQFKAIATPTMSKFLHMTLHLQNGLCRDLGQTLAVALKGAIVFEFKDASEQEASNDVPALEDQMSNLRNVVSEMDTLLKSSSADEKKNIAKLCLDLLQSKHPLTFSNPKDHAFLDDPSVEFFIFREGHTTVYAVLSNTHLASMVQLPEVPGFNDYTLRFNASHPTNQPVTISELEHLKSCYIRFQRGKKHLEAGKAIEDTKLKVVPPGFDRTPKAVRRLVAQGSLKKKDQLQKVQAMLSWASLVASESVCVPQANVQPLVDSHHEQCSVCEDSV